MTRQFSSSANQLTARQSREQEKGSGAKKRFRHEPYRIFLSAYRARSGPAQRPSQESEETVGDMSQAKAPVSISPSRAPPDKSQLLLLGLQLLNKGLKLPCAVVPPHVQTTAATDKPKPSPVKVASSPPVRGTAPASPGPEDEVNVRKRKRNLNEDLSEVERREKRWGHLVLGVAWQRRLGLSVIHAYTCFDS